MRRRHFIQLAAGGAAACYLGWRLSHNERGPYGFLRLKRTKYALGTQVSLTVLHDDRAEAETALAEAFAAIGQVEAQMSLYRSHSALNRLNRAGRLDNPPAQLVRVLREAARLSALTAGAFDVTVQPLWEVYHSHKQAGTLPEDAAIARTRRSVDWRRVEVTDELIRLRGEGTRITLNGMAQGLAADLAGQALRARGIAHALIDAGEVNALGEPARKGPWRVGIKHPRQPGELIGLAGLNGRCLSTSGDYETRFSGDFRHNHLFDPRTGQSPPALASVSVAAPTGLAADALSTAVYILGPERGRALVEATPGADALFVTKSGQLTRTTGFPFSAPPGEVSES
jgi:thiamine biosynthesis lipoprotein